MTLHTLTRIIGIPALFSVLAYVNFIQIFKLEFVPALLGMPIVLGLIVATLLLKLEKRNHEKAQHLNKLVKTLGELRTYETSNLNVRGAIHDLGNLLGLVGTTAEVLQIPNYDVDKGKIGRDLESVFEKLRDLLNHLIRETEGRTSEPVALVVTKAAEDITSALGVVAASSGHTIQVSEIGSEICVRVDPIDLEQIFLNLVMNAMQASNRPLHISIQIAEKENSCIITVEDNGDGIPESIRASLFNLGVSAREGGTGLGLALVKELVERNGGEISFTSDAGGTRFRMQFSRCAS